jgi:hypothetical protein
MNFNDQTVTWNTDTITMNNRITLSALETLIEVYMSANEAQMLRDEYSRVTKILGAEYKQSASKCWHQDMRNTP